MSKKHNDPWVRTFSVSEPTRHKKGYTLYKVTSKVFPKNSIEAITQVTVWKRYNDFKKLHKALSALHQGLYLKGTFPPFAKARFFGRFDDNIVEERRKCALELLEFTSKYPPLFTSQVFVKFFEFGQIIESPVEQDEDLCAPVLQPVRSANSKLSNGSSSFLIPNNVEKANSLGGIWQHRQMADDISISSQNATEGEEEDDDAEEEDDRTTFTDDDLSISKPLPDLSEFDPVLQSSAPDNNSISKPKDICNDWLLSAYQSCGQSQTESIDSEGIVMFPTPFGDLEDLEIVSSLSPVSKSFDTDPFSDPRVVQSHEKATQDLGQSSLPMDLSEFDPIVSSNTGDGHLPSAQNVLVADEQSFIVLAAKSISAAQDAEMFGKYHDAFVFYKSAVSILLQGIQNDLGSAQSEAVQKKVLQYLKRAEEIYENHLCEKQLQTSLEDAVKTSTSEIPAHLLRQPVINLTKYRVIGILNKVLLVIDVVTNLTCVVKVLRKSSFVHQHSNAPNIAPHGVKFMVQLYEVYETADAYFLVLEYASGGKVWDHISSYLLRSPPSITNEDDFSNSRPKLNSELPNVYSGIKPQMNIEPSPVETNENLLNVAANPEAHSNSVNSDEGDPTSSSSYAALFKNYMTGASLENKALLAKCHLELDDDDIKFADEDVGDDLLAEKESHTIASSSQPVLDISDFDSITNLKSREMLVDDCFSNGRSIETIISNSKNLLSDVNKLLYCSDDPSIPNYRARNSPGPGSKSITSCRNNIIPDVELSHCASDTDLKTFLSGEGKKELYNFETMIRTSKNFDKHQPETCGHLSSSTGNLELSPTQKTNFTEAFNKMDAAIALAMAKPVRLPETCIMHWSSEIVIALAALHKLGIIWQDLMPENILLGTDGHILLTYQSQWSNVDRMPSDFAKKNLYAAPEIGSVFPISAACDWWSFGAITFELIIGKRLVSCYPCGISSHTNMSLPDDISLEASDLLKKLLKYDSCERLGAGPLGLEEIKSHPFFRSVIWENLEY